MADPAFRQRFLDAMSRAAATVNVVTTDGPGGRAGVTVSAMSPVSVDGESPVILVCLHYQGKASRPTLVNGVFTVNLLREDQSFISDAFAGRGDPPGDDPFSCAEWQPMSTGSERLVDPLVAFDCEVLSSSRVGTHYVITGSVKEIFIAEQGRPLVFANRAYGAADRISHFSVESTRPDNALRVGTLSAIGPDILPGVFHQMEMARGRFVSDLYEGDQRKISELLLSGEIDLALLYDVDLDDNLPRVALSTFQPRILLPTEHPLAHRGMLHLADLQDEPLILLDAPPTRQYILSLFEQCGLQPTIAYRPWGIAMAHGMVRQGLGYCVVNPVQPLNFGRESGIACVELAEHLPPLTVVVATRPGPRPDIVDAFFEACRGLC